MEPIHVKNRVEAVQAYAIGSVVAADTPVPTSLSSAFMADPRNDDLRGATGPGGDVGAPLDLSW